MRRAKLVACMLSLSVVMAMAGCTTNPSGGKETTPAQTEESKTEKTTESVSGSTEEETEAQTEKQTEKATEVPETEKETEKETKPADPSLSEKVLQNDEAYAAMVKKSLVQTGNNYRLKKVIEKAQNGEQVNIAIIGGSITEGAVASPNSLCYASQTAKYFAETYGTGENVHFINAGVSGTPSTLGMMRYKDHVDEQLGGQADLVIVEFAVNDADDPTNGDCYESLVRNVLKQDNDPAVILLFSVFQSQWNLQDRMIPVGKHYDLPMVSIKNAVVPSIKAGTLTNKEYFAADGWHPTNAGHQIMTDCMINLFKEIDAEEIAEADIEIPEKGRIGNSFEGVVGFTSADTIEGLTVNPGSFTLKDSAIPGLQYDSSRKILPDNWKRDTSSNESMTVDVNCKNFTLAYKQSNSKTYGKMEVYVDGVLKTTIDGYNKGGWNNAYSVVIFKDQEAADHHIEFKMAEGDEDKDFTIMIMGYTR